MLQKTISTLLTLVLVTGELPATGLSPHSERNGSIASRFTAEAIVTSFQWVRSRLLNAPFAPARSQGSELAHDIQDPGHPARIILDEARALPNEALLNESSGISAAGVAELRGLLAAIEELNAARVELRAAVLAADEAIIPVAGARLQAALIMIRMVQDSWTLSPQREVIDRVAENARHLLDFWSRHRPPQTSGGMESLAIPMLAEGLIDARTQDPALLAGFPVGEAARLSYVVTRLHRLHGLLRKDQDEWILRYFNERTENEFLDADTAAHWKNGIPGWTPLRIEEERRALQPTPEEIEKQISFTGFGAFLWRTTHRLRRVVVLMLLMASVFPWMQRITFSSLFRGWRRAAVTDVTGRSSKRPSVTKTTDPDTKGQALINQLERLRQHAGALNRTLQTAQQHVGQSRERLQVVADRLADLDQQLSAIDFPEQDKEPSTPDRDFESFTKNLVAGRVISLPRAKERNGEAATSSASQEAFRPTAEKTSGQTVAAFEKSVVGFIPDGGVWATFNSATSEWSRKTITLADLSVPEGLPAGQTDNKVAYTAKSSIAFIHVPPGYLPTIDGAQLPDSAMTYAIGKGPDNLYYLVLPEYTKPIDVSVGLKWTGARWDIPSLGPEASTPLEQDPWTDEAHLFQGTLAGKPAAEQALLEKAWIAAHFEYENGNFPTEPGRLLFWLLHYTQEFPGFGGFNVADCDGAASVGAGALRMARTAAGLVTGLEVESLKSVITAHAAHAKVVYQGEKGPAIEDMTPPDRVPQPDDNRPGHGEKAQARRRVEAEKLRVYVEQHQREKELQDAMALEAEAAKKATEAQRKLKELEARMPPNQTLRALQTLPGLLEKVKAAVSETCRTQPDSAAEVFKDEASLDIWLNPWLTGSAVPGPTLERFKAAVLERALRELPTGLQADVRQHHSRQTARVVETGSQPVAVLLDNAKTAPGTVVRMDGSENFPKPIPDTQANVRTDDVLPFIHPEDPSDTEFPARWVAGAHGPMLLVSPRHVYAPDGRTVGYPPLSAAPSHISETSDGRTFVVEIDATSTRARDLLTGEIFPMQGTFLLDTGRFPNAAFHTDKNGSVFYVGLALTNPPLASVYRLGNAEPVLTVSMNQNLSLITWAGHVLAYTRDLADVPNPVMKNLTGSPDMPFPAQAFQVFDNKPLTARFIVQPNFQDGIAIFTYHGGDAVFSLGSGTRLGFFPGNKVNQCMFDQFGAPYVVLESLRYPTSRSLSTPWDRTLVALERTDIRPISIPIGADLVKVVGSDGYVLKLPNASRPTEPMLEIHRGWNGPPLLAFQGVNPDSFLGLAKGNRIFYIQKRAGERAQLLSTDYYRSFGQAAAPVSSPDAEDVSVSEGAGDPWNREFVFFEKLGDTWRPRTISGNPLNALKVRNPTKEGPEDYDLSIRLLGGQSVRARWDGRQLRHVPVATALPAFQIRRAPNGEIYRVYDDEIIRESDGKKVSAAGVLNIHDVQFGPDGRGYYRYPVGLGYEEELLAFEMPRRSAYKGEGLLYQVLPQGDVLVIKGLQTTATDFNGPITLNRLSRSLEPGTPIPINGDSGWVEAGRRGFLIWISPAKNVSAKPYWFDGSSAPTALASFIPSQDENLSTLSRLQESADGRWMRVDASGGQTFLLTVPTAERDRLLTEAAQELRAHPLDARTGDWARLVRALLARFAANSDISNSQRIELVLLAQSIGDYNAAAQFLPSESSLSPEERAVFRAEFLQWLQQFLAAVNTLYHGMPAPSIFIPSPQGWWERRMLSQVTLYEERSPILSRGPSRVAEYRRLEAPFVDLVQRAPWLKPSPEELGQKALTSEELTRMMMTEGRRQFYTWFLLAELVLTLSIVVIRRLNARQTRQLMESWATDFSLQGYGAPQAFSLVAALKTVPLSQRRLFKRFMKSYTNLPKPVQAAVFLLLRTQLLGPIRGSGLKSWPKEYVKAFLEVVFFVPLFLEIRAAFRGGEPWRRLEKAERAGRLSPEYRTGEVYHPEHWLRSLLTDISYYANEGVPSSTLQRAS